jgi:hypothetical protein
VDQILSGRLIILTPSPILIITTITLISLTTTITTTTAILTTSITTIIILTIITLITYQAIIGLRRTTSCRAFSRPPNLLRMLLLILLIWPIIKSSTIIKLTKIKISFIIKTKIEFNKIPIIHTVIVIITKTKMRMNDVLIKYNYK